MLTVIISVRAVLPYVHVPMVVNKVLTGSSFERTQW